MARYVNPNALTGYVSSCPGHYETLSNLRETMRYCGGDCRDACKPVMPAEGPGIALPLLVLPPAEVEEPQAAPDPDWHPNVVKVEGSFGGRLAVLSVGMSEEEIASARHFLTTLCYAYSCGLPVAVVLRPGWSLQLLGTDEGPTYG